MLHNFETKIELYVLIKIFFSKFPNMKHIIDLAKSTTKSYTEQSYQLDYKFLLYKIIGNSLLSGDMSLPSIQEKSVNIVDSVVVPENMNKDVEEKIVGGSAGVSAEFDDEVVYEVTPLILISLGVNFPKNNMFILINQKEVCPHFLQNS